MLESSEPYSVSDCANTFKLVSCPAKARKSVNYSPGPQSPMNSDMNIQFLGALGFAAVLFVMATLYIMRRRSRLGKRTPKF
jgi:hypothetical protein